MVPIGSPDFPHLKHAFHTGTSREPRFHLFKHLPLYFPVPSPLNSVKPMAEDAPFFTVLSASGAVTKTASRSDLLKQADQIATALKLQSDESVMLSTNGDPHSTMVGFLACLGSWAQLVVPNPKDSTNIDKFSQTENIVAAFGDVNVPKSAGQRVARV